VRFSSNLQARAARFPQGCKRSQPTDHSRSSVCPAASLFLGADGERLTRRTLQYRILRVFKKSI
jgi:hypothetical protein